MNSLKNLINEIKNDETVKRFKELEEIIDQDENLKKTFNKLLDLQKIMVQDEAKKSKDLPSSTLAYNTQLNIVLGHILMDEYLDVLEVVNNDLQLIKQIISDEINAKFE